MSDETPEPGGMDGLQGLIMQSIRAVRDGTLDIDKAKAVNSLAQTLINSAKVEVEFLRATNRTHSPFFVRDTERLTRDGNGVVKTTTNGPWQGLTHRMREE